MLSFIIYGSFTYRLCTNYAPFMMSQEPMLGRLTVLQSPVPSAFGSPERRGSTNPNPESVTRESGFAELKVCISIMQEPMLGHLTGLWSPVPSTSDSPERRGSTKPHPKSLTREIDPQSSEFP